MKKFLVILVVLLLLVGCTKKEVEPEEPALNSMRGTDYKYDFIQFIDVYAFGPNGDGMLEVTPKEFTVDDFETEDEYILMRKTIDSLKLYIVPGNDRESHLQADKIQKLSNGDIITLSIKDSYTDQGFGASINLEPYSLEITGLPEATEMNLFDESSVEFYGLQGTSEVYYELKKGGVIPDEIIDHIKYSIKTDTDGLIKDKTILSINAELDSEFLNNEENPYYTTDIYMKKQNYSYSLYGEKVLVNMAEPIDFNTVKRDQLSAALYDAVNSTEIKKGGVTYYLDSIATLQQTKDETAKTRDPYAYTVTSLASNENGEQMCIRNNIRMVKYKDKINVLSTSNTENIQMEFCGKNYDSMNMIINFNEVELDENGNVVENSETATPESTEAAE